MNFRSSDEAFIDMPASSTLSHANPSLEVILNTSPTEFLFLRHPSRVEYLNLVEEYESIALEEFFETLKRVDSKGGDRIRAFSRRAGFNGEHAHLRGSYISKLFPKSGESALDGMSIEDQRRLIESCLAKTRLDAQQKLTAAAFRIALPLDLRTFGEQNYNFETAAREIVVEAATQWDRSVYRLNRARARDFIRFLIGKNILLLPFSKAASAEFMSYFDLKDPFIGEKKRAVLEAFVHEAQVVQKRKAIKNLCWKARHILMCSTLDSVEDISEPLIETIDRLSDDFVARGAANQRDGKSIVSELSEFRAVLRMLTDLRNEARPESPIDGFDGYAGDWRSVRSIAALSSIGSDYPNVMALPEVRQGSQETHQANSNSRGVALNSSSAAYVVTAHFDESCMKEIVSSFEALRLNRFFDQLALVDSANSDRLRAWAPKRVNAPKEATWVRIEALSKVVGSQLPILEQIDAVSKLSHEAQREVLDQLRCTDRSRAAKVLSLRTFRNIVSLDLGSVIAGPFDCVKFVRCAISVATTVPGDAPRSSRDSNLDAHRPIARDFLKFLVGRGLLLFPLGADEQLMRPIVKDEDDPFLDAGRVALFERLRDLYKLRISKSSTNFVLHAVKSLLMSSDLKSANEVGTGLLRAYEAGFTDALMKQCAEESWTESSLDNRICMLRRAIELYSEAAHASDPGILLEYDFINKKLPSGRWNQGRSKSFDWAIAKTARLGNWKALFDKYVDFEGSQVKQLRPIRRHLNSWLDYLLTLNAIPERPEDIRRSTHIASEQVGAQTFTNYLTSSGYSRSTFSSCLHRLSAFFEWYTYKVRDEGSNFSNPIYLEVDGMRPDPSNGQTHRHALNQDQIELLKTVISRNNFEFCRTHPSLKRDYVQVVDRNTGEIVDTWFPGRARALMLLLSLPMRSFQARWMDSGEGDEVRIDLDFASGSAVAQERTNTHRNATPTRKMGPFRTSMDPDGSTFVGLYCPTNKTAIAHTSKEVGHTFPWVADEVLENVRAMQEWQSRFGLPLKGPIEATMEEGVSNRTYRTKAMVYPLFRDPTRMDRTQPVSRDRITFLFYVALNEVDQICRQSNPTLQPLIKRLSSKNASSSFECIYDLHSLRVSGITNLLEAGVPLEVVSRFVAGHASLVMTLWYNKIGLKKVRAQLSAARDQLLKSDIDVEEQLLQSPRAGEYEVRQGISQIRDATWRVKLDGICPGAVCSEGVIDGYGNPSPVPDSRCSLCRFHLTGPRFLLGNSLLMTEIFRRVHAREEEMRGVQDQLNSVLAAKQRGDHVAQGDINAFEGRISQLRNLQRLDLLDLAARKAAMEASRKLTMEGREGALIYPGSDEELRSGLRTGLHIENLHLLSLATEIIPGYRNDDAVRELRDVIENLLATNGVLVPLATLSANERLVAVNLFTDVLLSSIDGEANQIDAVSGRRALSEFRAPDGRALQQVFVALNERIAELKGSHRAISVLELKSVLAEEIEG